MTSWLVRGLPRQLVVMWENNRCSILFHFEVAALEAGDAPLGRARREGGGRRRLVERDAGLLPPLLALVEPDVRGVPRSPLRWTTKSSRKLAGELRRQGWQISAGTGGGLVGAGGVG